MPCFADPSPRQADARLTDLLGIHPFSTSTLYRPASRMELVQAVAEITAAGRSARAVGSMWALSETNVNEDAIICTDDLGRWLCQPWPDDHAQLPPERLLPQAWDRSTLAAMQASLQTPGTPEFQPMAGSRPLIWVEAGIKLKRLLADLAACGLALPTMGAGAGQSLAGMLSTSTHGGDLHVPPLSSWLRAVHIVSTSGQEWWITGTGTPILPGDLGTQPGWCPDTKVVVDDQMLDAVRVSAGRFGAIYAVVLEVVPQYGLLEVATRHGWLGPDGIRAQLAATTSTANGLFDRTITRASEGWLTSTLITPLDLELGDLAAAKANGDFNASVVEPRVIERRALYADLDAVRRADDGGPVLDGTVRQVSHLNIVISLAGGGANGFIQRRWRVPAPTPNSAYQPLPAHDKLVRAILEAKDDANKLVPILQDLFDPLHDMAWTNLIDIHSLANNAVGTAALTRFRSHVIPTICASAANAADALIGVLHAAIARGGPPDLLFGLICLDGVIADAVAAKVRGQVDAAIGAGVGVPQDIMVARQPWAPGVRLGPASGRVIGEDPPEAGAPSMLDTHDYALDGLQSGHSAEFHFDAFGGAYLEFIDRVVALGQSDTILGLIGLRFTPRARASLAMQQFDLTASVEVQVGRNRKSDQMLGQFRTIVAWGHELGGIPHWGQEFDPAGFDAGASYPRLGPWRERLRTVVGGAPDPFSTPFSRACGLEPATTAVPDVPTSTVDDLIALQPLLTA